MYHLLQDLILSKYHSAMLGLLKMQVQPVNYHRIKMLHCSVFNLKSFGSAKNTDSRTILFRGSDRTRCRYTATNDSVFPKRCVIFFQIHLQRSMAPCRLFVRTHAREQKVRIHQTLASLPISHWNCY